MIPAISGTLTVGQVLSSSNGTWTQCSPPCSYTYRWFHEGSVIGGATSSTYTLVSGDLSQRITVGVIATNSFGAGAEALSVVSDPTISTTARYVSFSTGNDSWDGTAPAFVSGTTGPWKTIAQVNTQTFAAGTSVLFKRGDIWTNDNGGITTITLLSGSVGTSGNPIVFDAYGTGANPILDGSVDGSPSGTGSWTNVGTNLWQSVATYKPSTVFGVSYSGTSGNPLVVTWSFTGGNQLPSNTVAIIFASTGTLPTNVSASTTYYVINASGSTFNISLTVGGAAINAGASLGTGTQTSGVNGFAFFDANDPGSLLWGFSQRGGSAPASVNNASFGLMVGGGAGGVWYKPGDGTANIGTTQNNWNFNTDNWTVQIFSTTNPGTAMPGLRIALDSAAFNLAAVNSFITIQNFTIQYMGASTMVKSLASNITIRDCVFQWIGGSNIGGRSTSASRAGDATEFQGSYSNIMVERNYFFQMFDLVTAPQAYTAGAHDNQVMRNNIYDHFSIANWPELGSTGTFNGFKLYNNTIYCGSSWSWDQRPDLSGHQGWGLRGTTASPLVATNLVFQNNVFDGLSTYGVILSGTGGDRNFSYYAPVTINFNSWRALSGNVRISTTSADETMATWKSLTTFEVNGSIDVDPLFVNGATGDFTPQGGSPLRNAGTNLFATGVVWDFNRKPRPTSGNFTIGAIQ